MSRDVAAIILAGGEGRRIGGAKPLRHFRGEHRTVTATAIHDNLPLLVGENAFYIPLQHSFSKMHRLPGMAISPFVVLPNVQQHRQRVSRQSLTSLFDRDFPDFGGCFSDDF